MEVVLRMVAQLAAAAVFVVVGVLVACGPAQKPSSGTRVKPSATITYAGQGIGLHFHGADTRMQGWLTETATQHLALAEGWLKPWGMAYPAVGQIHFWHSFQALTLERRRRVRLGRFLDFHGSSVQAMFFDPADNSLHVLVTPKGVTTRHAGLSEALAHLHLQDWTHHRLGVTQWQTWEQLAETLDVRLEASR